MPNSSLSLLVVTGLSGAGKSIAAKTLEDLGYYTMDNMPLSVIKKLVEMFFDLGVNATKIALVIDSRSGNSSDAYDVIQLLKTRYSAKVLFLTASQDILVNRYKENRRKHPLGNDLLESIKKEEEFLSDIKSISDNVIDTSKMNINELVYNISTFVEGSDKKELFVNITSFGFKNGIPTDSDLVFDVRFISNPFFVPELKARNGLDQEVSSYVFSQEVTQTFFTMLRGMLIFLIPQYKKEGKPYLKISIGCTGGKHRSVAIVERIGSELRQFADVQIKHRDIDK